MPRRLAVPVLCLVLAACVTLPAPTPAGPMLSEPDGATGAAEVGGRPYQGLGFDACTAPSTTTMSAWLASPYRAVGIYIGGNSRGCSQPNLTPSWVTTAVGQGWSLLPLYVGSQAPSGCTMVNYSNRINANTTTAASQGVSEANDAADQAAALGLGYRTPIYFDLEAYTRSTACSLPVKAFINAWTRTLRSRCYVSGFYSSSASGIADQAQFFADPAYAAPHDIWFANWNGNPALFGDPYFPDTLWAFQQRHHQYDGPEEEEYGGVTIEIDKDSSDGAAARMLPVRRSPRCWYSNSPPKRP